MLIRSFRIKNYKSIKDSRDCYLDRGNITILAGKNESGKTAILEALEDFNIEKNIREEAKPLLDENAKPYLKVTFELNKNELKNIFNELELKIGKKERATVDIIKIYPNQCSLGLDSIERLGLRGIENDKKNTKNEILKIIDEVVDLRNKFQKIEISKIKLKTKVDREFVKNISDFINQTKPKIINYILDERIRSKYLAKLEKVENLIIEIEKLVNIDTRLLETLKKLIPNFILFTSFEDIFPSKLIFDEADNNNMIQDLNILSNLNINLIKSNKDSEKMRHKERLNIKLKKEYKKFWTQDLANLHMDWDSQNIMFFIKEGNAFFEPKMRSKGKQWHLSFYIRVSARAKEKKENIILIDEPGLFLHAKAQEDVLNKLVDLSKDSTIIFTTHSPYLIDIDNLSRIRLVTKDSRTGTSISNKIQKNADIETLTPIITAIGLDLSLGLDIAKENNILLEGISDYYYICAFKEILKYNFKKEVHIIPCQGASKARILAPLLIGWGLNFCVIFDNDKEGKREKSRFEKEMRHLDVKILTISEKVNIEIEDLFDRQDFVEHVLDLEVDNLPKDKSNSQIIKEDGKKYDMVLKAKTFFEKSKIGSFELSNKTKEKYSSLLKKIDNILFS